MTSLSPKEFKEEFRGRVTDFVVSGYLLNTGNRKPTEKEKMGEEMYLKLEKWVMEQMHPMMEYPIVSSEEIEVSEDQNSLDF